MALNETLSAIKRINPDDHVFFIELIREFKEVPCCLRRLLFVYLFDLHEVLSIATLMNVIIHHEHLLRDCVSINLVGVNIRFSCVHIANFIFFSDNFSSWVDLPQVILNSILDVHIGHCEDIVAH